MKRSFKFYRKNEAEVMESLGLKPTLNSGSTWIEKEDGQNDFVICQLKSTDAQSIAVKQKDLRALENNAITSYKLPLFAIQFLNTNEVWLMAKPEDFSKIAEYIDTGKTEIEKPVIDSVNTTINKKVISSSENARNDFHKLRNQKYEKKRSAK